MGLLLLALLSLLVNASLLDHVDPFLGSGGDAYGAASLPPGNSENLGFLVLLVLLIHVVVARRSAPVFKHARIS